MQHTTIIQNTKTILTFCYVTDTLKHTLYKLLKNFKSFNLKTDYDKLTFIPRYKIYAFKHNITQNYINLFIKNIQKHITELQDNIKINQKPTFTYSFAYGLKVKNIPQVIPENIEKYISTEYKMSKFIHSLVLNLIILCYFPKLKWFNKDYVEISLLNNVIIEINQNITITYKNNQNIFSEFNIETTINNIINITTEPEPIVADIYTKQDAINNKQYVSEIKNGVNDDIKTLSTGSIEGTNGQFSFGKYGDFSVIIMNKNGYICAKNIITEAIKYENELRLQRNRKPIQRKDFNDWKQNIDVLELYNTLKDETGIPVSSLEDECNINLPAFNYLKGKYIHPDLVNSLAMWVSSSYALKINRIINGIFIQKKKDKWQQLIKEKDNHILELVKETKAQTLKINNLLQLAEKQNIKIDYMHGDIKGIINIGESIAEALPPTQKIQKKELLMIIKFETIDDNNIYKYMAIKRQSRSVITTLNKIEKIRPHFKEIYCSDLYTNAQYIWNRIKEDLAKSEQISFKYSSFNLINFSEIALIYKINNLINSQVNKYNNSEPVMIYQK